MDEPSRLAQLGGNVPARRRLVKSLARSAKKLGNTLHSAVDAAHAKVLHDDVVFDAVLRSFAAQARFLHAAEGRDFGGDEPGVDADHAVLERLGDAPDAADVAAVEVR